MSEYEIIFRHFKRSPNGYEVWVKAGPWANSTVNFIDIKKLYKKYFNKNLNLNEYAQIDKEMKTFFKIIHYV